MNPKKFSHKHSLFHRDDEPVADASGKINLQNNQQFNGYSDLDNVYNQGPVKPNYTKAELDTVDMDDRIAHEIRAQKYRIFIVSFISFLMMIVAVFFIACYYGATIGHNGRGEPTKWLIPTKNVPVPGAMIPLLVVGLAIFILAMIEYFNLLTNVRSYKGDILANRGGTPYFLIKSYKSLVARVIYANWLAITCYVLEGVIIAIFWGLKATVFKHTAGKFNTELIIMYILAGITFVLHMFVLLTARYRKGNLTAVNNAPIISDDEQRKIKRHANWVCFIIFIVIVAIIFFIAAIVWLILRKRKRRPVLQ